MEFSPTLQGAWNTIFAFHYPRQHDAVASRAGEEWTDKDISHLAAQEAAEIATAALKAIEDGSYNPTFAPSAVVISNGESDEKYYCYGPVKIQSE